MDRRQFTKASALALAATRLPAFAQTKSPAKPIGFAAVGLGSISDIFMRACATSPSAKITALVTGHSAEKGIKYAAMYGIPKSSIYTYEQYDRLADNKEVDAVYIGLPNSMHCEYTVRAARMGKHVLCEKPMAISSAEAHSMIQECRTANVKLMIAYRMHYDPTWQQAMQIIESGGIGDIQSFQGGFFNQQSAGAWRLSRKLGGGGSVLDLGIYPLNAIRHITREEPASYSAIVSTRDFSGRFAEVEQSVEWTMKLPSGIIASCGCSYGQDGPSFFTINGDKGFLQFQPAFVYDGLHLFGRAENKPIDVVATGKAPFQFALEAEHFVDCIRDHKRPESPGEEGLKDMLAIEAIYKSAGTPIA